MKCTRDVVVEVWIISETAQPGFDKKKVKMFSGQFYPTRKIIMDEILKVLRHVNWTWETKPKYR